MGALHPTRDPTLWVRWGKSAPRFAVYYDGSRAPGYPPDPMSFRLRHWNSARTGVLCRVVARSDWPSSSLVRAVRESPGVGRENPIGLADIDMFKPPAPESTADARDPSTSSSRSIGKFHRARAEKSFARGRANGARRSNVIPCSVIALQVSGRVSASLVTAFGMKSARDRRATFTETCCLS
jgi:hypothetical protein